MDEVSISLFIQGLNVDENRETWMKFGNLINRTHPTNAQLLLKQQKILIEFLPFSFVLTVTRT